MLNINIPTRGRPAKLMECLDSIDYAGQMKIYIHCHNYDVDIPKQIKRSAQSRYKIIQNEAFLTIDSHNSVCKEPGDFLGISDDIVFFPGAIARAVSELKERFEGDGVIDFVVSNMSAPDGCFMLLGDKFISKFQDRTPYFPEYRFMYASAELRDYAKSIGKFFKCSEAELNHFHPSVTGQPDETHNRIRSKGIINGDRELYDKRHRSGLLWGHNKA